MTGAREVVVLGGGLSRFDRARPDGTPVDWIIEATLAAIEDAGVDPATLEHSVVAYESEILARQVTLGQVVQDQLGLVPRPSVRVEAGGGTGGAALRTAFAYLRAGLCDSMLVVGADAVGRQVPASTVRQVYALSGDVDFEMAAGGFFMAYYALMMQEHMRRYGTTEEQMAGISVKNHRNALHNPLAAMPMAITVADVLESPLVVAPYKRLDCAILADGAAALVLATETWARSRSRAFEDRPHVYLTGSGCATERVRLGDRPQPYPGLAHFRAKREAAAHAYAMAGITDPRREIDVAEVADTYTGAELQAYEDLGFCPPGESGPLSEEGVFDLGGELPTNTSGGLMGQGAPPRGPWGSPRRSRSSASSAGNARRSGRSRGPAGASPTSTEAPRASPPSTSSSDGTDRGGRGPAKARGAQPPRADRGGGRGGPLGRLPRGRDHRLRPPVPVPPLARQAVAIFPRARTAPPDGDPLRELRSGVAPAPRAVSGRHAGDGVGRARPDRHPGRGEP